MIRGLKMPSVTDAQFKFFMMLGTSVIIPLLGFILMILWNMNGDNVRFETQISQMQKDIAELKQDRKVALEAKE